jgi:cytochrome c peroxidase
MKTQSALLSTATALVAAMVGADALSAAESSTVLTPQALQEIAQVETAIDRIEAQTIPDQSGPAGRAAGKANPV